MAGQYYGYATTYGGPGISSMYSSRITGSSSDLYSDSSRYLGSDTLRVTDPSKYSSIDRASIYLNQSENKKLYGADVGSYAAGIGSDGTKSLYSQSSWPGGDILSSSFTEVPGAKRSAAEALYHQTVLGTHNTVGQSESLFPANPLAKRPRVESGKNLPVYPQRPGEKDCAFYMLTRTCKFGSSCKFDHPFWVPEGGISDWKEVPPVANVESLPERAGEPDCPYFLKTQKCKFGSRCKFNHPKERFGLSVEGEMIDTPSLPERPAEPPCAYYLKTGKCKFGSTCKFNHPKDMQLTTSAVEDNVVEPKELVIKNGESAGSVNPSDTFVPVTPALMHNSKGLPIRPGEVDCPFYLKTGSCKYGTTCRFNHPDRIAVNPPIASAFGLVGSPAANLPLGVINPATSLLPTIDPRLAQTQLGLGTTIYPQRPGQMECDFYMKTGSCKFGETCKYHHPIDRSAPTPSMMRMALQQNVKLTLAGLPRREDATICAYYLKTGTCKFGPTCRFDHPPPGELIAKAASQGTNTADVEEPKNTAEENPESDVQ